MNLLEELAYAWRHPHRYCFEDQAGQDKLTRQLGSFLWLVFKYLLRPELMVDPYNEL